MGVTIQCDGRVEVKHAPGHFITITIVYKNAEVQYYQTDKCEVEMSLCVSGTHKPYCSISVSTQKEKITTSSVSFDFPYDLRKLAFDTYTEIVDAMSRAGMVDPTNQEE